MGPGAKWGKKREKKAIPVTPVTVRVQLAFKTPREVVNQAADVAAPLVPLL
jgi:hypothetical protein